MNFPSTSYKFLFALLIACLPFATQAQVDSGYVEIKKGKLFYQIYGSGKPLVFLNGGPGFSSKGYKAFAEELASCRKVILFDQRGTGKSEIDKESEVTIDDMISDLELLRAHLGIDEWDMMGHSFGGTYALYYLNEFRNRIDKLILSATPYYYNRLNGAWSGSAIDYSHIYNVTSEKVIEDLKKEFNSSNPSLETKIRFEQSANAIEFVYKKESFVSAAVWFAKANYNSSINHEVTNSVRKNKLYVDQLRRFKNPVLIVHGSNDFIQLENPKKNHSVFPNSILKIIEQSGHMMSIDQPDEYFCILKEFLAN